MANPYVFIVGCPRSGTTLLQRMADAHPLLGVTNESRWFDKRWIVEWLDEGRGLTREGFVTPELGSRMVEHPRFSRLKMSREEVFMLLGNGQPVSFADFVTRLFDLYGQRIGKALVGNKTPIYVRRLHTLHKLWPGARFVHLIRDGRDVCLSVVPWAKGPIFKDKFNTSRDYPISTVALWWELSVRLGRQAGKFLGPELYYEIRYESLIRNPEEECAALCAFLGLPYDGAMLRFHQGRTKTDHALDAKRAWLPLTQGLRDWRSQMPTDDVERFEAVVGDLLDELSYPRAILHPRPESLEEAARVRNLLAQDSNWMGTVRPAQTDTPAPASRVSEPRAKSGGAAGAFEGI